MDKLTANLQHDSCYRGATAQDAGRIVDLVRNSFEPIILSMTPYGCSGITAFNEGNLLAQRIGGDVWFFVCEIENQVIGCLELKLSIDSVFVSYICVDPIVQSHGLGSRLLRYGIEAVRQVHHHWVWLDVLENNHVARSWYEKLGFEAEFVTEWWQVTLPKVSKSIGYVSGLPQAEASHNQFGFSQVNVTSPLGTYGVGRLGDQWLRITAPDFFADDAAIAMVADLAPERKAIALIRQEDATALTVFEKELRARTIRLRLELSSLSPTM